MLDKANPLPGVTAMPQVTDVLCAELCCLIMIEKVSSLVKCKVKQLYRLSSCIILSGITCFSF